MGKKVVAEFVGTFLLVFFGVGSAVFGIAGTGAVGEFGVTAIGAVGVALAFGLVLLVLVYAIGPVSGCHVNPAVTLAVVLNKGLNTAVAAGYVVAQVAGGIAGAAMLKLLTSGLGATDVTGSLGSNDYGENIDVGGAFVLEVVLTFLLVLVVLLVTSRQAAPGFAGLAIGSALAVIHLVGIPLTGTSVNPARSLGPALFAGGAPLSHVWLFIAAPLVGGLLGWAVFKLVAVSKAELETAAAG